MCNISANLNTQCECVPLSAAVSLSNTPRVRDSARTLLATRNKTLWVFTFVLSQSAGTQQHLLSISFYHWGDEEFREGLSSPNHSFKTKLLSSKQMVKSSDPCTMKLNEFHRNIWQQNPVGLMLKTITSGTSKGTSWLLVFRISANSCNVLSRGIIFSSCILFQTPSARCQSPFISVEF